MTRDQDVVWCFPAMLSLVIVIWLLCGQIPLNRILAALSVDYPEKEDHVVRETASMSHVIMEETGVRLAYTKCWVSTKMSSWTPSFRISSVDIQSPILCKCSEVTQVSGALPWKSTSNSCLFAVAYVRVEPGVFVGSPKAHESGSWLPNIDAILFMCVHVHACMCVCTHVMCVGSHRG